MRCRLSPGDCLRADILLMRFAIFGNIHQAQKSQHAERLFQLLQQHGAQLCISSEFYRFLTEDLHRRVPEVEKIVDDTFAADMVISLGGDGTFLNAARHVGRKGIPILGINTGRLGFLADIAPAEMEETIDEIYNNHYCIEERNVLQLKCDNPKLLEAPYGLNEIAVLKRDSSSMISIRTSINGNYLTTYLADGLIVSTPTGSTAYSLSVGGPIIVPQSNTLSLTPIAPHSLNMRPIVIRDDWTVTLDVESRSHNYLVSIDGRSQSCSQTTRLTILRADYTVRVVKRYGHAFFDTLREKMMWGADVR